MTDLDTELAFMRALPGIALLGISDDQRRERIRFAILEEELENQSFRFGPDQIMETYAQAFERCYSRPLERW